MEKFSLKFYISALMILLALSAYPLVMGAKIVILKLQNNAIGPEDYARYVVPYTAVCAAVILSAALYPLLIKLGGYSRLAATVLGFCSFIGLELYMEGITINSTAAKSTLEWQLYSCIGTSAAVDAFKKEYSDAYKIHYFLISFVIIALITGLVYGYGRLGKRRSRQYFVYLNMQLFSTVIFIALCVFANFTGFFRDKTDLLSPLSSFLTALFFIVLSTASGIYAGSYLIGKGKTLGVSLPSAVSVIVCSLMYYGESKMLDGKVYRFGESWFFNGINHIVVSPSDIAIIIVSGVLTALLVKAVNRNYNYSNGYYHIQ